jgi:hypothetical protein
MSLLNVECPKMLLCLPHSAWFDCNYNKHSTRTFYIQQGHSTLNKDNLHSTRTFYTQQGQSTFKKDNLHSTRTILICTVSSSLPITSVQWQRNIGGSITTINSNTNKYSDSTTTTPSLTIFNAASSDVGTYTCFASNSVGTGQKDNLHSTRTIYIQQGYVTVHYNSQFYFSNNNHHRISQTIISYTTTLNYSSTTNYNYRYLLQSTYN